MRNWTEEVVVSVDKDVDITDITHVLGTTDMNLFLLSCLCSSIFPSGSATALSRRALGGDVACGTEP